MSLEPSPTVVTQQQLRIVAFVGVVVLALLQVVDVVTTRIALHQFGNVEANPIGRALLPHGHVEVVKALWILGLGMIVWKGKQTVASLVLIWAVVGLYAAVGLSNALTLGR